MNAAVRPYATAGVALLGASVIAISPLAPPMPGVQAMQRAVSSVAVELSASANPIENWVQLFKKSGANLGAIGQQIADSPAPIRSQIVANQIASLKALQTAFNDNVGTPLKLVFDGAPGAIDTARGQLQSGDITGAFDTINNSIVIPLALAGVQAVSDSTVPLVSTVNNFAKAFAKLPDAVFQVLLPMTFPLVSTINVVVQATQDVYDGVVARDPGAVINTLVNLPANLVNGFLNGSGTILGFINAPGLLTPWDPNLGSLASGPIASLIQLRDVIAQAIGATPPATAATSAAAKVPAAARTVTLSTAAPALSAAPARGATKAASESAAESTAADAESTESATGSTGSTTAGTKATPAVTAASGTDSATGGSDSSSNDTTAGSSATGGHNSKASAGTKGSPGKSGRSARASK